MIEPRPELRPALELALGDATPPYGLQARVRRALDERLSAASKRRARVRLGVIALATLLLGVLIGLRAVPRTAGPTVKGSLLALRSARVLLEPDTELIVERDDERGASLRLVSGVVLIHVQKGTERSFELLAGATRVEVVGTIFGVSRQTGGRVAVEVVEGVVRVVDANGERRLAAGERWPAGTALFEASSDLTPLRAPIPVAPALPALPAPEAEATRVPAAGSASPAPRPASAPSSSASGVRVAEGNVAADAQRAYAQAKSLELGGDERAALAAYVVLSARPSEVAEDALFSVLRLHAASGERAAAQATVVQYRARFPRGRYARDVDVHALNLASAQGDEATLLRECEAFLSRFADDPRAWRFRLARARERAAHGDCASARALLQGVPMSDAKRALIAACPEP